MNSHKVFLFHKIQTTKISSSFDQPDFLILIPNDLNLISVDAKVVPSCLNIQSPPPKI